VRGKRCYFRWWWLIRDLDARYNHYVELLEPAGPRACIRCCDDPDDCPTHMGQFVPFVLKQKLRVEPTRSLLLLNKDTEGCPNVIPGNYFDCE